MAMRRPGWRRATRGTPGPRQAAEQRGDEAEGSGLVGLAPGATSCKAPNARPPCGR